MIFFQSLPFPSGVSSTCLESAIDAFARKLMFSFITHGLYLVIRIWQARPQNYSFKLSLLIAVFPTVLSTAYSVSSDIIAFAYGSLISPAFHSSK